ncbi:disulfide bond formation protein B [Acinetobacter larvae]|uniref:Disulfide bond formation protein B n=1 Tax=Acinetobacter larvae TaxID=1789224 RepID=A0A1B2M3J5_9GAMM|nr:disulfide bond formation protein B [Acinetobacter larvae]AOA59711.1 disulfide bond formation protein B [Acinetobacter larvae]
MQWRNYRFVSGILFLASVIGMAFALYLEHVKGLDPCPLCIFQRIGLIGLGFFSLLAFLHNPNSNVAKRVYAALASISILWSLAIAGRHIWIQSLPPDQVPSCGPGLDYLVSALPLQVVFQEVLSGSGECAAIDWQFLGLALPVWSSVFFAILTLIGIWQALRSYPR